MHKIIIAGIGPGAREYITPAAYQAAAGADILVAGKRNLAAFQELEKETYEFRSNSASLLSFINEKRKTKKVCVLVSGDPGFYSLLDFFREKVGENELEVIPGISSFQYFSARLKKSWKDFVLASMHGRSFDLKKCLGERDGVVLLTDRIHNPQFIARYLLDNHFDEALLYVGENLSYPNEKITIGRPREIIPQKFSDLCVVVIEKNGLAT
ncbi:MAG: precorrin-6y C5,15-methyltransferase (decarboxylating) subunit CbiE [Desulfitobacteriaceae bacterium]|nr:precorrin-6y C5,15-methyltransferase (decarboxylating) subunit CbiE [Desulfitobacteriaceae bacterium]